MKHIILLPTYNERDNVRYMVPAVFSYVPNSWIYVIDDNSPDGTSDVVLEMMTIYPQLVLWKREKKDGLGNAYKFALSKVLSDQEVSLVTIMDADGSHDPSYLPEMVKWSKEHDVIIGSRYVKGGSIENWELWRKALSYFGNLYARTISGLKVKDATAGFITMNRKSLVSLHLDGIYSSGYAFLMELKFIFGLNRQIKIKEIPIIFKERREGESKLSSQIISEGIILPVKLFIKRLTNNV